MGKKARETAKKVDAALADEEAALIRQTGVDLSTLRPRVSDEASFDKLVEAVKASTARNESVAAFKDRLASLGKGVLSVASQVAGFLDA
jgi:hypothetical protein